MKGLKLFQRYVFILFLIECGFSVTLKATVGVSINVLNKDGIIRIGEPLNLHFSVELEQPIVAGSRDPFHGCYCEINNVSEDTNSVTRLLIPSSFTVEDTEGLKYGRNFTIFYDHYRKRPVFDRVGEYSIKFPFERNVSSQTTVRVKEALPLDKEVMLLLSDPADYFFLEFGGYENEQEKTEIIVQLQKVADQHGETLLGKWTAARLGIEEYKEIEKKHRLGVKFVDKYRNGLINEPLVEQSHNHLNKALELPDEFPIREEALDNIIRIALFKGNNNKALFYANELIQKYPNGEFGRKVSVAKLQDEIAKLEARMAELAQERREKVDNKVE